MQTYTTLDNFLPLVMRDCPNVPRDVAIHEIREATIEFCRETRCWREDLALKNTAGNTTTKEYEMTVSANSESRITAFLSIRAANQPLSAMQEDELDRREPSWRTMTATVPTAFVPTGSAYIRPYPTPSTVVALEGKAAVTPTRTGTKISTDVFNDYAPAIASLAKARLMKMPGKPWTNPDMAAYEQQMADQAIDRTSSAYSRNFSTQARRTERNN